MNTPKHNCIHMCECKSSQVHSHGYDPTNKTLAIKFKNGGTYHYAGVSQETYDEMCKCDSIGSYLHKNVKGKFDFKRMSE